MPLKKCLSSMTFIFNIDFLACLFILLLGDVVNAGIARKSLMISNLKKDSILTDVTKGMSDADIETALRELTLSDLDTLSKLVDATGFRAYDYEEDAPNTFDSNVDDDSDIDTDFNIKELQNSDDTYADVAQTPIDQRLADFRIPYSDMSQFEGESLRLKRENPKQPGQISVDEDYIKQLENSFPRDQNNQDAIDVKKDHVRVKRA